MWTNSYSLLKTLWNQYFDNNRLENHDLMKSNLENSVVFEVLSKIYNYILNKKWPAKKQFTFKAALTFTCDWLRIIF
jgi:hypothetical protein